MQGLVSVEGADLTGDLLTLFVVLESAAWPDCGTPSHRDKGQQCTQSLTACTHICLTQDLLCKSTEEKLYGRAVNCSVHGLQQRGQLVHFGRTG